MTPSRYRKIGHGPAALANLFVPNDMIIFLDMAKGSAYKMEILHPSNRKTPTPAAACPRPTDLLVGRQSCRWPRRWPRTQAPRALLKVEGPDR